MNVCGLLRVIVVGDVGACDVLVLGAGHVFLLLACMVNSMSTLGWFGEIMYEASYVCIQFPGDYVFKVGS